MPKNATTKTKTKSNAKKKTPVEPKGVKRKSESDTTPSVAKKQKKVYSIKPPDAKLLVNHIGRNKKGEICFPDYPMFRPNLSPKEVLQAGSFGGTYFRPIKSGVTGEKYSGVWKELPKDWLEGLEVSKQVSSSAYRPEVNAYKVKCGGSLEMWESSGWIDKQDPYGWFMWYCRFYEGRRTEDDERQIGRWCRCASLTGRWRNNLITKVYNSKCAFDNPAISPVVRQTLQHWGYRLTKEDYERGAVRVAKRQGKK
ncbi:uncharacterized protein LOC144433254 [Glandiceps talaboti]